MHKCSSEKCSHQDDENDGKEIIKELNSLSLNFKTVVLADGKNFLVETYQWNELNLDDNGVPVWERVSGPFSMENLEQALDFSQENLNLMAGEIPDKNISEAETSQVSTILGNDNFLFLEPQNFTFQIVENDNLQEFSAEKCLVFTGLFVIKKEEKWLIGNCDNEQKITCWQSFDDLGSAISTLKK